MEKPSRPGNPDVVTVYSTTWCSDCHRAQRILDESAVDCEWIDIDEHPEAIPLLLEINGGFKSVPTILFPDGSVLVEPSDLELTEKLAKLEAS